VSDKTLEFVVRAKDQYGRVFDDLRRALRDVERDSAAGSSRMEEGMRSARKETGLLSISLEQLAQQAISTAAGFIIRDVIVGSWNSLRSMIRDTGKELIGVNRSWEIYEAQFYVQLGRSHEATIQRMREIEDFAIKTPFNLDEIVEADLTMQTFGLHSEQAARRWGFAGSEIRRIAGDVAAGTRGTFSEIGLWLGRFAVGDVGRAIRRFQELGAVTRQELQQMGVEFDKSGSIVSPLDQAMSALLTVMQQKFGGLMEIESSTLRGMESNLEDFMTKQRRRWGEPVFDLYKEGLSSLMTFLDSEGVQEMLEIARGMFTAGVEWIGDMARAWGSGFAELIIRAADWGANIVESLAGGIQGSDAIVRALNSVSRTMAHWLAPGSPPRLLPELTDWGAGAAEAWLQGWRVSSPLARTMLEDLHRSLAPWLSGDSFDSGDFRAAFGARAPEFEPFVRTQRALTAAMEATAVAREELAHTEEEGDAEAIAAAEERLQLSMEEERQARVRAEAEERHVVEKANAEAKVLEAIREQTKAVVERERAEAAAASKAEERAAEAERRAIYQAELQYRLVVAGSAAAQLPIWEAELEKAEEGSAEWWQIKTRLVSLQRQAAEEAKKAGQQAGGSLAEGMLGGVQGGMAAISGDLEDAVIEPIDWRGIWGAIGTTVREALLAELRKVPALLWDAFIDIDQQFSRWLGQEFVRQVEGLSVDLTGMTLPELQAWAENMVDWAVAGGGALKAEQLGYQVAHKIYVTIEEFFRASETSDGLGEEMAESLRRAVLSVGPKLVQIGDSIVVGIVRGITDNWGWRSNAAFQRVLSMGWLERWERAFSPQSHVPQTGQHSRFASGTSFAPGGLALVGEEGPELVQLPRGSRVHSAPETRSLLEPSPSTVHVHSGAIQINIGQGDAREVEVGVLRALRQIGVPA
jgi:hypothetical protein